MTLLELGVQDWAVIIAAITTAIVTVVGAVTTSIMNLRRNANYKLDTDEKLEAIQQDVNSLKP